MTNDVKNSSDGYQAGGHGTRDTEINPDELWARTKAYARRHNLSRHPVVGFDRMSRRSHVDNTPLIGAIAYLAGYDQRQKEDNGPTLDRDAALIAHAYGYPNWRTVPEERQADFKEWATAARIMVGGTYAD